MADNTLINRYRQYKAGTTKVVNWLANTARSCEDVTGIVPSIRAAKDSAKQAKRKQKHAVASLNITVTLTTSQLVSLAHVVVKAAVSIPEDIIRTTKAVIAGRQVSADWYASYTSPTDLTLCEQNQTHQHFITVLEEVLHLPETSPGFAPLKVPKASKKGHVNPSEKHHKDDDSMSNMFSCLNIYEPVNLNATDSTSTSRLPANKSLASDTKDPKTRSKVEFELEEQDGDRSLAVWCLLYDLRELRQEVRRRWLDDRNGEIFFSAVAEITANSVIMMQYAEVQFVRQYPEMESYMAVLDHLHLEVNAVRRNVWVCPRSSNGVADVSSGRVCSDSVADLVCPHACIIFTEFAEALARKLGEQPRNTESGQNGYL